MSALRTDRDLRKFVQDTVAELERPGGRDPGHLTRDGLRFDRKRIAAARLAEFDTKFAPMLADAEGEARVHHARLEKAIEAKLGMPGALALQRAAATATWFASLTPDGIEQREFLQRVRGGKDLDALLVGIAAPSVGPTAALHSASRNTIVAQLAPEAAQTVGGREITGEFDYRVDLPAADLATKTVRTLHAEARQALVEIGLSGDFANGIEPGEVGDRELAHLTMVFQPLQAEGKRLGVFEPVPDPEAPPGGKPLEQRSPAELMALDAAARRLKASEAARAKNQQTGS